MDRIDVIVGIIKGLRPFAEVNASTELIDSRIITSLTLFELISELELVFNIRIDEDLIIWENFTSAEKILNTVLGDNI